MTAVIEKVTGYVTRRSASGAAELLVFRPARGSIQVPAGTVEPGEALDDAALRETMEESGLTDLRPAGFLGSIEVPLVDRSRAPLEDVIIRRKPGLEYGVGVYVPRAYWLRVVERIEGFARVELEGYSGWLPAASLAERMDRYFYHFETTAPTPERWYVQDEGHDPWECFWVPLNPRPKLNHETEAWEKKYYDKVLASLG